MDTPETADEKKALKENKRRVQAAGRHLHRTQRRHQRGISRINGEIEAVRRSKKLGSLALGQSLLYEDRLEVGKLHFALNDPHLRVEVAVGGDKAKVHLTISGAAGVKTLSLPGNTEAAIRTYAAAVRQAVSSYAEVHQNKARTIERLEGDLARAEGDVQELQSARAALFEEESRTGLIYSPPRWKLKAVAAAAAAFVVIAGVGSLTDDETATPAAVAAGPAATSSAVVATTSAPATERATAAATATKAPKKTTPAPPPSTTTAPKVKKTPKKPPKAPKIVYKHLTQRQWALIVRDPDGHIGETVVVYGLVTQADSNTGTDSVRADVGGVRGAPDYWGDYSYPTNTIATSGGVDLSELVEGDLFRARVTVMGSQQYETTLGGYLTVPVIEIEKGARIGHQ